MGDYTEIRLVAFGVLASWVAFILLWSYLKPYRKEQKILRKWFWDDLLLYTVAQSVVLGYIIFSFVRWVGDALGVQEPTLLGDWPIWAQLVFFTITHDFFIYVFHVAMHKNKFLYRFHEAHHSVEDVDWIAGSRSHPFEIFINQSVEFGAIALLSGSPEVAIMKGFISSAWGIWIHHNADVKTGWLQYIINGSEMHRWHHTPEFERTKNFATKLAIWDWIFGTAHLPKDTVVRRYGLADPDYPGGYFRQFVAFFRPFGPPTETPPPY